jgi:uncharacterized protein (TIGR00730 family)
MGEVASTFVKLSGPESVHGIIPRPLVRTEKDDTLRNGESHSNTNSPAQQPKIERTMTNEEIEMLESNGTQNTEKPDPDKKSIPMSQYGSTTIVPDMHTRKRMMAQEVEAGGPGSGFVALAGGYGTLEEVMEMVTWNQLGIHQLPIVLVNTNKYWDGVLEWVKNSIDEGFVGQMNRDILVSVDSTDQVVDALKRYKVAEGRFKLDWNKS